MKEMKEAGLSKEQAKQILEEVYFKEFSVWGNKNWLMKAFRRWASTDFRIHG